MKCHVSALALALPLLNFTPRMAAADTATQVRGFAPVSVSAANYRTTSREELVRAVELDQAAVNPDAPALQSLKKPQYFFFIPGEIFDADLRYEQVTEILTAALAKKGYINGADPQGIIREPEKITLALRVNYGTLPWRLPTVRSQDITWYDGMVPRPRGMGLHVLGGERTWDQRAGGNDESFAAIAANDTASGSSVYGGGGGKGGAGAGGSSSGGASGNTGAASVAGPNLGSAASPGGEYGATRDFHVIVVDAFDYQELKKDGKSARRLWTTFVSAPKEPKQKFSAVAETLARNAIPYFGETTKGLQVYSDVRAEVRIGDLVEIKDEPAPAKK
jgi:uncharacterized membrane protein YgcG